MRKINIPLGITVSSPIRFPNPGVQELAKFNLDTADQDLEIVKYNGGMFIWAASEIERRLNDFIADAIFSRPDNGAVSPQKSFFNRHFLEASHLEFSGKLKIAMEIIETRCLLDKKGREGFEGKLRIIMRYRNAFAHGKLVFHTDRGCVLSYFTNGHKSEVIDNDFAGRLEGYFISAAQAIDELSVKLSTPWGKNTNPQ